MNRRRRQSAASAHERLQPWQLTAQVAAIVVAVGLVYLPALRADFVWDDEQLVTGNPLLRTFSGLLEIWAGGRTADYFPVASTVFWIEYYLFGSKAVGYHAVNILLQTADALLVWLVLHRLKVPGAWLAGLIFGIHPVHAESVAWISELKNLLSMFFALLSIFCFLFFAALFVVVDGLSDTGLPDAIYRNLQPLFGSSVTAQTWNLTWFSAAGSNIFSNVPFVLVAGKWITRFADPELMWKVLALATTFAGNLTIIGSVANMIVVESAREHIEVSFWDYARFGIPITILTTAAGVMVLLVLR